MGDVTAWQRKALTAALLVFQRLPERLKRVLVRAGTPHYTVGAVCAVQHDQAVLMLSQPHRAGWSLPGGLLETGETPTEAVVREVLEETGLRIDPGDQVAVGVHPEGQSVDVIFRVVVDHRPDLELSSEARRARWFALDDLADMDEDTSRILAVLRGAGADPVPGRLRS
ncbi:MAG TPA: NUDIX domain-containing protein [Ornithinimicrobium sp.]|uniref:NUDIX hydrolase n=1 Tax=Ornithinimicrobium sp. TaxID=1977084 RepID=UPI002B497096|nr:NUDIX domain-containing protein [Ornithinimicrobium sp.]HKJ11573.1 NUDIX domain-containing protein [Ornithinimicrobium sp.]